MISVITCSIDPTKFAALKASLQAAMGTESWELIAIHDAKSLAEGYNRAIPSAQGEIVIFCHDDIEIWSPDFPARLKRHLRHYDLIGVAGTDRLISGHWTYSAHPHVFGQIIYPKNDGSFEVTIFCVPRRVVENIQALDGVFIAARRSVLSKITFDAETFDGFHLYDLDFTFRAHRAGLRLAIANDVNLFHHSRGSYNQAWKRYCDKFMEKWKGAVEPMELPKFIVGGIYVKSRAQALAAMNPPYWAYADPPDEK